jgi:phosphoribosylglycinamide formyltransferase-1
MIKIHPSLLPAYPGLHTHRRALADGVRAARVHRHFVTPEVDCRTDHRAGRRARP